MVDENRIEARIVIEIMGRPPEHIKETLQTLVVRMGAEKGVEIVNKAIHDPIAVENTDNLFTAFAEIEVKFNSVIEFFSVVFNYMPANVELTHPANLKMQSNSVTELANFILGKLHQYDAIVKRTINEKDILLKQVKYLKGEGKVDPIKREITMSVKSEESFEESDSDNTKPQDRER
jgi:hypothetical protein